MLHQNFSYILEKKAMLHPEETAIVESHGTKAYSYGELLGRTCRLANALRDAGITRGDRICCLTGNTVEYIDLFMAAARLGALLSPLNYRLSAFEMGKIVDDAKPKAFIFDVEFAEKAEKVCSDSRNFLC